MDHQATVTLTALNGDLTIAERTLTLTLTDPVIYIGRASKSVAKGILAAADNAWFDNPVMSRNHAHIKFHGDDKTVNITDIGSMHGTYLNDILLPKDTPMAMSENDVVVFGAEVRRGTEIFPACAFKVNYNLSTYKAANTFAFPDSSDIEDEVEENYDGFSGDDMEDPQHASSSEDGASIELAPLKLSQDITAIDLTGDDFPGSSPSNRLDLTGETDAEKRMMDLMAGRPDDIDDNADSTSIAMYAGKLPILVDTEDEEEDEEIELSSEPDNQSEDGASDDSDRGRMHGIFEDDSEGSVADSIADSDVDLDPPNMVAEPRTVVPESATLSNLTRYALATDSNPTVHLSDVRTRVELSESDDEDDESDYGLSEAEAEGMRAFYGDGPSIEIQDSFGFEDEVENETTAAPTHASNSVLGRDMDSAVLGLKAGIPATKPPPAPEILENLRSNNLPVVRQPSPSDAAMVKSDIPSTGLRAYQAQDLKSEMTHALGEKSGKYAFFAAREANRAKINAEESPRPTFTASNRAANMFSGLKSTPFASSPVINDNSKAVRSNNVSSGQVSSSTTPIPESSMAVDPADTIMLDSFVVGSAEPLLGKTFDSTPSIPTREPCDFLDKPDQFSVPYRAPSPLPDMTSAFNYHTSKDSMAAASGPKSSLRSAIKIPDIIENCSPFLRTTSLKRKSDNISHATDHELRNWAKSVASGISPVVTQSDLQNTVQDVSSGIIAPAPSALEPRPAKRFKKLLENVGYVALGGATLFAALVATAPELV